MTNYHFNDDQIGNSRTLYYRIHSIGTLDANSFYSSVVKVYIPIVETGFTVMPNPVRSGKEIGINTSNLPVGNYHISLLDETGKVVFVTDQKLSSGMNVLRFTIPLILTGNYIINLNNERGGMWTKKLMISEK